MHFFLSPFGSSGDVFPMLGLAVELQRRGAQVTLATNPHFESRIRENGIAFHPIGTEEDYRRIASHPDLWHPRRSFGYLFENLKPFILPQYEFFERASQEESAIGIVNCFGFGGLAAMEKFNFPVYTLHLQPAVLWSDLNPPKMPNLHGPKWMRRLLFRIGERLVLDRTACPFLNPWRTSLGLPPIRHLTRAWNSSRGILCLFPDWYAPPQRDWPQPCLQTDFPLWNHASDQPLSDELQRFLEQGDAPILFTPGSANRHGATFFRVAMEAMERMKKRAIFLTEYREQIPSPLPESILWVPYVALDQLLPRAAAFVHHGGIGSASQALLASIPQVIMPLAHDQFDNAERLERLGVASSLPPNRFRTDRLIATLQTLLSDPAVPVRCQESASRMDKGRGLRDMARLLCDDRGWTLACQ
jgi:rhamnosyltransferase subunit B